MRRFIQSLWRRVSKNPSFVLINVAGLSIGMASFFLIALYCWHEFSYDTSQPEKDRIFRVEYKINLAEEINAGRIPPPIGPQLKGFFPEMEEAARIYSRNVSVETAADHQFELERVFFADSTLTEIFHFDALAGSVDRALYAPRAVMLTEKTALQLFGSPLEAVGKQLRLAGVPDFEVVAVVEDWPSNSHLAFSMILPYQAMITIEPPQARQLAQHIINNNWIATHSFTYVKLAQGQNPMAVNDRFDDFIQQFGHEQFRDKQSFTLLPIEDIHLHSENGGTRPPGNINYLYLFLLVGFIILLIACINFINLSVADAIPRAKAIGIRKILGAKRGSLIRQRIGEVFVIATVAFGLSLMLVLIGLPMLNGITGQEIEFLPRSQPEQALFMLGVLLVAGALSSIYPAIAATRFSATEVLQNGISKARGSDGQRLRSALITFQFVAAVGIIASTLVIAKQLGHLQSKSLGFNYEQVVNIPLNSSENMNALFRPGDSTLRQRMNTFDEMITQHAQVVAVTQSDRAPGLGAVARGVWNEHVPQEDNFFARILAVDYDYTRTFDLKLESGRHFDKEFGSDHLSSFMVNEQAVEALGWKNPEEAIGKTMVLEGKEGQVVGVLSDFNYASLHQSIDPLILEVRPGAFSYFNARIRPDDINGTLAFIEDKWKEFFPQKVFEYSFLDENLREAYLAETQLGKIVKYASFLAILIACFGLLGLAAMMVRQRFKEIGIRKVLGASVQQILQLIAKDFVKLVLLAVLLVIPLHWYLLDKWLEDFAYRIDYPWWSVLVSGLVVLTVAFFTISTQVVRAATANPTEAIRDE